MADNDPSPDPDHWLYRLDPHQWLQAADNELARARAAFVDRQHRTALTYARRAAGMALNALLWLGEDPTYGRSYMDHLKGLQEDPSAPEDIRAAATLLRSTPLRPPLVSIGPKGGIGDGAQAEPAERIVQYVRQLVNHASHA